MGGASSFLAMLAIAGFLTATWLATKVSKMAGVSSVVLEIATGVVFGPSVLGLISDEYTMCETRRHAKCLPPEDFLDLLDNGQPVSATMGRIIGMDVCRRSGDNEDASRTTKLATAAPTTTTVAPSTTMRHLWGGKRGAALDDEVQSAWPPPTLGQDDDDGRATGMQPMLGTTAPEVNEVVGAGNIIDFDKGGGSGGGSGVGLFASGGADRRLGGSDASYVQCIERTCEADVAAHCGHSPSVFTLIGHAGVALMIFESGMHFDFEKAAAVGPQACLVALLGTILPFASGTFLMMLYGKPLLPDALAVGTALAPSSVGIALRLLGEAGVLQYDFGQVIITAAFVDDILSLVLFNFVFSLRGEFDAIKPIIGVVFMGLAMVMAAKFWPRMINGVLLPRLPRRGGDLKVTSEDEALFFVMMALLIGYASITHVLGTHLLGCFFAGVSFASIDSASRRGHTHHVWVRQTKKLTSWMIRIFFACAVAFSIPVQELLSFEAFWKGSVLGLIPCILTKLLCAPFMGRARWVIGWAMVGRAEFAYLIAQVAVATHMIDETTFSVTIWALLYATILAPLVFQTVLNRYVRAEGLVQAEPKLFDDDLEEEEEEVDDDGRALVEPPSTHLEVDGPAAMDQDPEAQTSCAKQPDELDKIMLAGDYLEEADLAQGAGDAMEQATSECAMQPRVIHKRVVKFWFGQAPDRKVNESNGFLCCFFFKKGIV